MLQSTSLLRGKTQPRSGRRAGRIVLQSTSLLRGKTRWKKNFRRTQNKLQSTSLLRGKTFSLYHILKGEVASIHFPLAREDKELQQWRWKKDASIHFPLAREDAVTFILTHPEDSFNPLPSCEGRQQKTGPVDGF